MNQDYLNVKMADLISYFKNNEDIVTVYLFGSYGTSLYDPGRSDIDLAIIFNRDLTLREETVVDAKICSILESDNLDVVNLNKTRADICYQLLATGTIIFERNSITTADFVENTLRHYFDHDLALEKMKADAGDVYQYVSEGFVDFNKFIDEINNYLARVQD